MPHAAPHRPHAGLAAFRTACRAALGVATFAGPLAPAARAQDLTFTVRSQATAAARAGAPGGGTAATTVQMSGPNARVNFTQPPLPTMGPGSYMLLRGAEQQMVLVNPRDRQALVLSADGLGAGLGALTNNALVRTTTRDAQFSFEDLGAGERVAGQPTRRVRLRTSGVSEVRILGRTQRSTVTTTTEQWMAPTPAGVDAAALRAWSRSMSNGVRRTNADLGAQVAEYERRFGDGLAMRTVMITETTDGRRITVDTMRSEVTELSRGRLDPSLFAIPAGFETIDQRQLAASTQRADGDARAAADTAAAPNARDEARRAVRGAIGGMFGRRRP